MPSTTFNVVDSIDIRGRGVVLVSDKTFSDFLEVKCCNVEITTPNGTVLKDVGYKEWVHRGSAVQEEEIEALFIKKRTSFEIPIGSFVKITQA